MATTTVYNKYKAQALNGLINLTTDTIKVLLVSSSYTVNADHHFVADVVAAELAGTGYARKTLASPTVTEDDTNDLAFFDAADVVWTGANFGTVDAAIVYKLVTNDADSPLIACINLTPHVVTNGGDFTAQWAAGGLVKAT
jgi:hypothetical protein